MIRSKATVRLAASGHSPYRAFRADGQHLCRDFGKQASSPPRQVSGDHLGISFPGALVRFCVTLDVDFPEIAKSVELPRFGARCWAAV
jgi:hypothetical protein